MTDDKDIDCEWSSAIQLSPLDPKVELRLEWKPTNISFGRVPWNQFIYFGLESWYSSKVEVPWSYGRDEIPHLLTHKNHGITMDLWQKWVDQATQLWIERNESCRQLIQFGNYYTLTHFVMITIWILTVYFPENMVSREWISVMVILSILLFIIHLCWGQFRKYELRRCEEKWSNLIQDIESSVQGLRVEHCYNMTTPIVICCQPINSSKYTVGLTFIIQETAGGNVSEVNFYRKEEQQVTEQQLNVNPSSLEKTDVSPQSHPTTGYPNDSLWNSASGNTIHSNDWKLKLIPIHTMSHQNRTTVVTWSQNREDVPTWLSSRGITLEIWKEWWDHANIISMDRVQQNCNLAKWKRNGYIPIVVILLLLIPLMIFVPEQSDYFTIGFWFIMSVAYIYAVAVSIYWEYIQQSNFLRNETKWSDLVQMIHAKIRKELGLCANQCYHVSNGNNDLLRYTVGIEFSPLSHLTHPLLEIV
jgi:hypothetical protein